LPTSWPPPRRSGLCRAPRRHEQAHALGDLRQRPRQEPGHPGGAIDFKANSAVSLETAKQGIVLLRNTGNALPLAKTAQHIAVIGGYADTACCRARAPARCRARTAAAVIPLGGTGPWASFIAEQYHRSAPSMRSRRWPSGRGDFRTGTYIADAVAAAKKADVAIVFATKWASEGLDQADLTLPAVRMR
jgi:beta-glucosidase